MGKAVLVVDAEAGVQVHLTRFLEEFGFVAHVATGRADALAAARSIEPALVVTAHRFPDGDALELVRQLRAELRSRVAVVVIAPPLWIERFQDTSDGRRVQAWLPQPVQGVDFYQQVKTWYGQEIPHPTEAAAGAPPPPKPARQVKPRPTLKPNTTPPPAPRAPRLVGNLERTPPPRLFYRLSNVETSGVLSLNHGTTRIALHVDSGQLVNVASNYIPDLSLGVILVRRGILTGRELSGARQRWEREGGLFGETLVAMNLVDSLRLTDALRDQWKKKALSIFAENWRLANFALDQSKDGVVVQEGYRRPIRPLIHEGVVTYYTPERIIETFGKKGRLTSPLRVNRSRAESLMRDVGAPELRAVYEQLQRTPAVEAALAATTLDRAAFWQCLYTLFVTEIFVFE